MMRLAQAAIICLGAIVLGLLGQAIWSQPEPVSGTSDQVVIAAATRYFNAVDRFLATGDDRDLRATLGVDFASWTSGSQTPTAFEAYRAQLETVRVLFPGLELQQAILDAGDQIVTVQLIPLASRPAFFAGVRISPADLLGETEILRFARGHLIARWGFPTARGAFIAYPMASAGAPRGATLERWTLDGRDQATPAVGVSPLVLLVEQGQVRIELQKDSSHRGVLWATNGQQGTVAAPTAFDLPAGAALCLPAGAIWRIRASGDRPATVLAVLLESITFGDIHHPSQESQAAGDALDAGGQVVLDGASTGVEFGAVHLAQGSELDVDPASGSTLVLLESGTVDLESPARTPIPFAAGTVRLVTAGASRRLLVTSATGADLYLVHLAPVALRDETPTCLTRRVSGPPHPQTGKLCSA